jgi:hypothetical protein
MSWRQQVSPVSLAYSVDSRPTSETSRPASTCPRRARSGGASRRRAASAGDPVVPPGPPVEGPVVVAAVPVAVVWPAAPLAPRADGRGWDRPSTRRRPARRLTVSQSYADACSRYRCEQGRLRLRKGSAHRADAHWLRVSSLRIPTPSRVIYTSCHDVPGALRGTRLLVRVHRRVRENGAGCIPD